MKHSTLTKLSSTSSITTYLDKLELTEEKNASSDQRDSVSNNVSTTNQDFKSITNDQGENVCTTSQDFKGDNTLIFSGVGKCALGYIGTCDVQTTICTDNVCNENASETGLAQIMESQFESSTSAQSCSSVIDIERSYPLERETPTCHDLEELATKDVDAIKCGDTKMNQHSGIISGTGYVPSPLICDVLKINESNMLECMDQNKLNTTIGYVGTEQVSHEVMKCDYIGQSEINCKTVSGYVGTEQVSHDAMKHDYIGQSEINCNTVSGYISTDQVTQDKNLIEYMDQNDNTSNGYNFTEKVSPVSNLVHMDQNEQDSNLARGYIGTGQVDRYRI